MENKPSRSNERLDAEIDESFPASDPPSHTPVGGTKATPDVPADRHDHGQDKPHGLPSDDRHATETAAGMIHGTHPAETDERSGE